MSLSCLGAISNERSSQYSKWIQWHESSEETLIITVAWVDCALNFTAPNAQGLQSKILSDMDVYCGETHIQDKSGKEIWP